ncbi:MAG: pyridoxal phosphate-dependent aminotransferase [Thermoplasmata archaeon]
MPAPGFDVFRFAHDHYDEVAWMCQNTNHLVPPGIVQPAVEAALRGRRYEMYPYAPGDPRLRQLVLEDLGLPADSSCLITAGGTESLYMLARALLRPGDEVLASDPSYLIIHKFIELAGARPIPIDIYAPPYRLDANRLLEARTSKTKMILLIDPLNPLGSGYPRSEVRAIAEIAHDHHLLLLNDVTYRDFADAPTLATEFAPEETLTVWSVSKNCGLAGLRLGGLVGPRSILSEVGRYNTNDLGVNVFAQAAAVAALATKKTWIESVRRTTRANQERIHQALGPIEGVDLPVFPSQANMFAVDIGATGVTPDALQYELLTRHHVFVRSGSYLSPRHGGRFVRVSFSNPTNDIDRFVGAFAPALHAVRAPTVSVPAP